MKKPIYLSIVIPAYNEETNIRLGALDKVFRYFEHKSYSWEVIVVNDGSSDDTSVLLEKLRKNNSNLKIINNPHQGKAATVITGITHAQGRIVLFTDLDQATPISEIEKILPNFDKGYDLVIGSRNQYRQGAPLPRLIMARGFMLLRTLILGLRGITDTQCGFKAFKKHAAKTIISKLKIYGSGKPASGASVSAGFDLELLYIAKKNNFSIKEVPVEWHYVETRRVSPLKDSWEGFLDIIKIKLMAKKSYYSK